MVLLNEPSKQQLNSLEPCSYIQPCIGQIQYKKIYDRSPLTMLSTFGIIFLIQTLVSTQHKFLPLTKLDAPKHLARMHVWGCPAYVLHPTLQDGKKIPKWRPRVRRWQFLGYSKNHSSTVGLIQNLRTGNISPQYHVVYDDHYYSVTSSNNMTINDLTSDSPFWTELVRLNSETYLKDIHPDDLPNVPDLSKDWRKQDEMLEQQLKNTQPIPPNFQPPPNPVPPSFPMKYPNLCSG